MTSRSWLGALVLMLGMGPELAVSSSETEQLSLRAFRFDPLHEDPASSFAPASALRSPGPEDQPDYHLLQLKQHPNDAQLDALRATGITVLQYVPNRAFLVYAAPSALRAASLQPIYRWSGPLHPVYKVGPELLDAFRNQFQAVPAKVDSIYGPGWEEVFDVALFKQANLEGLASQLQLFQDVEILHRIELPSNYFNVIRLRMKPKTIAAVAAFPDVVHIDPYFRPQAEDERSCQINAGNYTGNVLDTTDYDPNSQFGLDGSNVTISVVDDGVGIPGDGGYYITAANAVNGPLRGASAGAQGHGHLNATIIAGTTPYAPTALDAGGFNLGLGVAPKAHIVNIPLLRAGYTGNEATTCEDTLNTMGPNGVRASASNNSWGGNPNGNVYNTAEAQYDGFVRDASSASTIDPLLVLFSAGNRGTAGLTQPKVAKNVVAVAASENVRPGFPSDGGSTGEADNLEQLPDFSSRGPAADGRIKPDMTAPGDAITGGRSGTTALYGNLDTHHRISSGTSHAVPQVAGAAALFTQFWKAGHAGINPRPATVKAALLNGTVEMSGAGATAPIPNGAEGWGRLSLKGMFGSTPTFYVDETVALSDLTQTFTLSGGVPDNNQPFRVSLVWSDPPGTSDPALVNNLDLVVLVGGTTYRGNVFIAGISTTGGPSDIRNNVENVFLPAGTVGPVEIQVIATALNGDGILGNADLTDQHFALVVRNFTNVPDFFLSSGLSNLSICAGETVEYPVSVGSFLGFSNPVTLSASGNPAGTTAVFDPNLIDPNFPAILSTLTIENTAAAAAGTYPITIQGSASGSGGHQETVTLKIATATPNPADLTAPANHAVDVAIPAVFSWQAPSQAETSTIEVATDADFTNIVATQNDLFEPTFTVSELNPSTLYYWRIRTTNACGTSSNSPTFTFTTAARICRSLSLAIPDNLPGGATDTLTFTSGTTLTDLNVSIQATHTWVGDLIFSLEHVETGTIVTLIDRPGHPAVQNGCTSNDIDVTLDSAAGTSVETQCNGSSPAISGTHRPNNSLAAFVGQNFGGTWTLRFSDSVSDDTGTLTQWCMVPNLTVDPPEPTATVTSTVTPTRTPSVTRTPSPTRTPTQIPPETPTRTRTPTETQPQPSETAQASPTATETTALPTETATLSSTPSASLTPTLSATSQTNSLTPTSTPSGPAVLSGSNPIWLGLSLLMLAIGLLTRRSRTVCAQDWRS